MYALTINNLVEKYPYSPNRLKIDNPDTSFPATLSLEILAEWGVFPVQPTPQPKVDDTKNIVEGLPVLDAGEWKQVWFVSDATPEEIAERQKQRDDEISMQKMNAYRNESDPLFFKAQRGEATMQEWLDKVAEIKARFASG